MERRGVFVGEAEVGKAGELLLVHRDAAGDLAEIFAERDLDQKLLGFAEAARPLQPLGVAGEASQGLGIGGKPGKRMQPVLLGIDGVSHDAPVGRDIARDRGAGLGKNLLDRGAGLANSPSRPSITAGRLPMVSAKLISRLLFSMPGRTIAARGPVKPVLSPASRRLPTPPCRGSGPATRFPRTAPRQGPR
jgi:hypothetical protein